MRDRIRFPRITRTLGLTKFAEIGSPQRRGPRPGTVSLPVMTVSTFMTPGRSQWGWVGTPFHALFEAMASLQGPITSSGDMTPFRPCPIFHSSQEEITIEESPSDWDRGTGTRAPDSGLHGRELVLRESEPLHSDQAMPALWSGLLGCVGR